MHETLRQHQRSTRVFACYDFARTTCAVQAHHVPGRTVGGATVRRAVASRATVSRATARCVSAGGSRCCSGICLVLRKNKSKNNKKKKEKKEAHTVSRVPTIKLVMMIMRRRVFFFFGGEGGRHYPISRLFLGFLGIQYSSIQLSILGYFRCGERRARERTYCM